MIWHKWRIQDQILITIREWRFKGIQTISWRNFLALMILIIKLIGRIFFIATKCCHIQCLRRLKGNLNYVIYGWPIKFVVLFSGSRKSEAFRVLHLREVVRDELWPEAAHGRTRTREDVHLRDMWKRVSRLELTINLTVLAQSNICIFFCVPIWLPIHTVLSFFSMIEWTRIWYRYWSWHGFDTISI